MLFNFVNVNTYKTCKLLNIKDIMKQSTSFTQVANNLLNVLQGYTKGIRFLLVMFVALTVSAEVWGETYTWTCSGSTVFSTSGSSLNGVTWKASITGSSQGTGVKGEKCVQIAKNNSLTLETTDFNNKNITAISIQTWGSQENTFYLKDGVTQLESTKIPKSYSTNGAKIDFSNVGVIKTKLVFEWAKATNAFNVRSITVTYETGSTGTTLYLGLFLAAFVAVRACVRRVECLYATFHHIIMSKIDFRSVHFAKECFVCFFSWFCVVFCR